MADSSLTVGAWGVFHWIRNFGGSENPVILENAGRLYRELRTLLPALEASYGRPPFAVHHNHETITRQFLTDSVADITTLALEDDTNYYLIAGDHSGTFSDVTLRLRDVAFKKKQPRTAAVRNEGWERPLTHDEERDEWTLPQHTMVFGDIKVWVIRKE